MTAYNNAADALYRIFDAQMQELGVRIRTQLVLPLCKKHKLEYLAGMGTCCFYSTGKRKLSMSNAFNARLEGFPDIAAAFDTLDYEIHHNNLVGFYVPDVRRKDWL